MFIKKGITDERIIQVKHKIASEAFGIMFFALLSIVFVKSIILKIPTKEFITEFILFIGVSFYVFIRMIILGVYAVNLQNSNKKRKLKIAVIADSIFLITMGIIQYFKNELNLIFLLCIGIIFFLAFYGILWLSEKIAEIQNKTDND